MKRQNPLEQLAEFADICRSASRYLDPNELQKDYESWRDKLPDNQQRLLRDGERVVQNIAKRRAIAR